MLRTGSGPPFADARRGDGGASPAMAGNTAGQRRVRGDHRVRRHMMPISRKRLGLVPSTLALALGGCGHVPFIQSPAQTADWSRAETVTVVATEYRFEPSRLAFRRDVPYRLH